MTCKNTKNIAMLSIAALFVLVSFAIPNVSAEESKGYEMVDDVAPVLTFTFRDGVETYEFPVFKMGENFAENSGVSFSVEGVVADSPLLHQAMDEAYERRLSGATYDYNLKYFEVKADFEKKDDSVIALLYHDCKIENYQVETLDSNDYESYFKKVGFAIVDKIDFECSGVNTDKKNTLLSSYSQFADFGKSGFKFANNVTNSVIFTFENGVEKIEFPVFNLISGYGESTDNVVAEFQVEGILDYYPLLYDAIDKSRQVSGLSTASNVDFDALVEFTNGDSVLRGLNFKDCRISNAEITTKSDKEEGFTGKSGFAVVHQLTFTCSGIKGVNTHYDALLGDGPVWKNRNITHEYVDPIQNTAKGLSAFTTITFADGIETIVFSMFKQNEVLSTSTQIKTQGISPTLELRGIVGDYPLLYHYLDENRKVHSVGGTNYKELVDIDVEIVSDMGVIRGFNFENCRATGYTVETDPNNEESYTKNSFAVENIFDFECQGYHPNNPAYDAMFAMDKANTESSSDLRNTDSWGPGFTVRE